MGTVIVPVSDQDRALDFYVGKLGFEKRTDAPYGDGDRWLEVAPPGAGTTISIVPPREGESAGIQTRTGFTSDDIDADHAELRARGVDVDPEVMRMGDPVPPMFFFRDPGREQLPDCRERLRYGFGVASTDLSGLQGKRVLITGAARGIGAALAERLAAHGAKLALIGLEPEKLAAVADRCGDGTFVAECDVSSQEQVVQAVDAAAEALGGLDVAVANAGIAAGGPLRSQDLRSWERVIEINLLGVFYTDRAALPHLERSRGYLLNIASTAAALRGPGMSAYCAAKAGVEALSDCLRIEMTPLNVSIGVAYFLFLDTDMVNDSEREMPLLQRAKAEMPSFLSRTYPLPPAIDEVVAAIAERRRRAAYPRWFLKALGIRQLFASPLAERRAAKSAAEAMREYEAMVAERGASAASATERTRELAGI